MWLNLFVGLLFGAASSAAAPTCGGVLTAKTGIINTPNFPAAFQTPIHCQWLISKSEDDNNASIVVYLTQVFVTSGLKFTEYLYYDDAYKAGARVVHEVSESSATHVKWLQVAGPFLLVELVLGRLEGHHLRALPKLLDVFGFNITYEISAAANPVKPFQCNTIECRFLGHCYANHNFSEYGCSCFTGYSGKDCGEGSLCTRHGRPTCHNGGTCRQMGAAAVNCDCPPEFTGDLCELPILEPVAGCEDGSCVMECPYDGNPANACNCNSNNSVVVTSDRIRFEAVIKLAERPKLTPELQQQMTAYLRGLNISKDIEVTNVSADGEISIQSWGVESSGTALQAALTRLSRLAGLRLLPGTPRFLSEPALFLQTVAVNQKPIVWEGAEFILSCVAQGSPYMTFHWHKDGVIVNVTKATRNTWMRLVGLEGAGGGRWSALLGVARASKSDAGLFRCQIVANSRQQCRALRLHVLAPEVRMAPMSVTAFKGDNVSLTCLSANSGGLHGKLGYSWTRNKALFPLTPGAEVWEDLAPAGSILHLYNIQKSGEYSCHVSSAVSARVRSVYVRAVNHGSNGNGGLCPAGEAWGLRWPIAAPADHLLECPPGFSGYVTRICEMKNAPYESEWNIPDFSNCLADGLSDIYSEYERITYGYGNMSANGIIKSYLAWIGKRPWLYPGEGVRIVRLAREALNYLQYIKSQTEKEESIEPFFKIINTLLQSEHGALDQQGLQEIQQAILLGGALSGGLSLRLSEINLYCNVYNKLVAHRIEFPYKNSSQEHWAKESIILYLSQIKDTPGIPERFVLIYINYKNLTKYYNSIYYSTEVKENSGLEFWVASHIVYIRTADEHGSPLILPHGKITFTILMYHTTPVPRPKVDGNIICGRYESGTWAKACESQHISSEITQCSCENQGMYALLLARETSQGDELDNSQGKELVAGAFGGGALGVFLSGLLLLPAWLRRRCCLMYLKLHYCFITSMALGLMLYCLTTDLCGNMTGGWLELLLLGGGAALVAQLLLLHAELAWPAPPPPHLPRTILMLMTGVCVLAALCSRAAGGDDWGLLLHSTPLTVFAAASALLAALHFLLCICVAARLRLLATKLPDRNNYIQKRMGLMRRSAAIFLCSKALEIACIVHYNLPGPSSSNALAATAILLGTMVFGCYIIRDETAGGLRRLLRPKETDWDCSSDYVNTSLSFFIKQGCEAESRSAPVGDSSIPLAQQPPSHWRSTASHSQHMPDHRDRSIGKQADIVKSVEFKNIPSGMDSPDRQPMNSMSGPVSSVCDLVPSCASTMPSVDPPTSHVQEYVTRVCVELGILSRAAPPPPGPPEPPILLCSVDFEPYSDHKYDVSNVDSADNCVLCIGKQKQDHAEIAPPPIKSCLKNKDVHSTYNKEILKESPVTDSEDDSNTASEQDVACEKSPVKVSDSQTSTDQPNIDGMLDLISHDLDYLLNRTAPTAPAAIPSNVKHVRQPSGDIKLFTVLDKIQEESL